MSGNIIGGVIGLGLSYISGGLISPTWGFALGSMIGGVVMPPDGGQGPRLQDLRPQSSEYGRPIPIVYSTIAIAGNVIWASDLVEVEGDSGGGKGGGGGPTQFSYYGNWAVSVCEGQRKIGRIWAGPEKRLIWDGRLLEGADVAAVRFYEGTEDQLPDPLIESYMGIGHAPAYRGTAYLVFENFPLVKDGNRIPFLWIEVGATTQASVTPDDLGNIFIQQVMDLGDDMWAAIFFGANRGFVVRKFSDYSFVHEHTYPLEEWASAGPLFSFDPLTQRFLQVIATPPTVSYLSYALVSGERLLHTVTAPTGADANPGHNVIGLCVHQGSIILATGGSTGEANRVSLWIIDPTTNVCTSLYTGLLPAGYSISDPGVLMPADSSATYVIGLATSGATKSLFKLPLTSGFVPVAIGDAAPNCGGGHDVQIDPSTGYVWSVGVAGGITYLRANDPVSEMVVFDTSIDLPNFALAPNGRTTFTFGHDQVVLAGGWGDGTIVGSNFDGYIVYDSTSFVQIFVGKGPAQGPCNQGIIYLQGQLWNESNHEYFGIRHTGVITPEHETGIGDPTATFLHFFDPVQKICLVNGRNFNMAGDDSGSSHTFIPNSLAEIVADLSLRAGLTEDQINVTALTDVVDGYAIANQMSVRDAIMALAPAYFFDAVESSGIIKYVKRGGAISMVVDDDDLGAYESGSDPVDPLETTRIMDEELPRVLNVNYILEATNYSQATRVAQRLIGNSMSEATTDLPLVLTDTKAQQVAEVNLHTPWVGRITYKFSLPRKYARAEPTDVIVVQGNTVRLVSVTNSSGRMQCDAVHDDANVYVPNVTVTETPPAPVPTTTSSDTILELM